MINKKSIFSLVAAGAMMLATASCGGNEEAETLTRQAERVNAQLAENVKQDPELFAGADAAYADSAFNVNITFADSMMQVSDYSQAMVEFFLSDEIKSKAGKDLDEIVNSLAKVKEPLRLTLTDVYGTTRSYDMSSATLRTLFKTQRSQLQLPQVRSEVLALLAGRAFRFAVGPGVQKADFALTSSFATYTIIYDNAKSYSGLNVANLKARYLKLLKPIYKSYGPLADAIVKMNQDLGIDGYRFVLTTPAGDSELKATLPWREILAD